MYQAAQTPTTRAARPESQRGITLVETLVTTAIMAVAAGTTIPGMTALRTQHQLAQAAAEFETDVQHARSLAVAGNQSLRVTFDSHGGTSCYIIHTGSADDCHCAGDGPALCHDEGQALRTVPFVAGSAIALSANVRSIVFDPVKGTSTPTGTVRLVARDGRAVHQVINIMGRVRSCSPGKGMPGYKAC